MTTAVLDFPGVSLTLSRPGTDDPSLRAWSSADELLLQEALSRLEAAPESRVLVVDDQYGALTLGLSRFSPDVVADSAQLSAALELNARLNPGSSAPEQVYSWLQPPAGTYDLVLLKIPREADYLAWLLRWANGALKPDGVILAAGMIKHLPDRSVDVFAGAVAVQSVGRAVKKARMMTCGRGEAPLDGWSGTWKGYELESGGVHVAAMPAVFAREKLDIGTRLMLPHLKPTLKSCLPGARVLDLACGNGILGLSALAAQPGIDMTFSDVSSQAVLSARRNTEVAFPDARGLFMHADGVAGGSEPFERILLNPPFHEGGVVGDHIALRLFEQASQNLSETGRLLMVGNRHLGYHRSLQRFFPHLRQLDANPKFVVFEAWLS
ncbi:16S rRNA (guanine1207-N2)-methyltransferase [Marinobacter antarcticus]|uniref:16S rRNA (Guanine1207-N2)-methyltransferase n=1 Tax=Marinobacter antarcticus TaxID=564117 RepID=A0A1M6S4K2_9GAMM|nr:methyltransferase [Marinobacter antarcticus]SHK39600.1 16S rRNA (guanine1207-N2)-methyltransferase [Marinobacter antarcticus]